MFRAFRSELIKLRRISVLMGPVAMLVFTFLGVYFAIVRTATGTNPDARAQLAQLVTTDGIELILGRLATILAAIALIIVAAGVAAEWSQGTLRNLLVQEPRRLQLLAGKMLAVALYVVVSAFVALLVGIGLAFFTMHAQGLSTAAWTSSAGINHLVGFVANSMFGVTGYIVMGLFFAVVTRSAPAAVGVSLAYVLAVENLLGSIWPDVAKWLPTHLFGTLSATSRSLGYGSAALVSLIWIAGFVLVSGTLFRLRDVSS